MAQPISFDITPESEASQLPFYRRQFFAAPQLVSAAEADLTGKTAIVTGANSGLGLECSRQLLDLGLSKLIIAVRDEAKGEAARKILLGAKEARPDQVVEVWKLDYASYESITFFAQRAESLERLDIVILNAGIHRGSFTLNPTTGHSEEVQTNYLSTVLLLLLFLRILKSKATSTSKPPAGRIVVVSSDMAAWAKFAERNEEPMLKAFDDETKWVAMDRYATSKLLGQLFIAELAKRVPPSLAVINCVNPGLCYGSEMARELGAIAAVYIRIVGRSAEVGARVLVNAAVKQDERSHGQYVEDGELRPMAPLVYSKDAEWITRRLWKETMEELSFAGVDDIVQSLG